MSLVHIALIVSACRSILGDGQLRQTCEFYVGTSAIHWSLWCFVFFENTITHHRSNPLTEILLALIEGIFESNFVPVNYNISLIYASCRHDGVIKWKHIPRYWPLCEGNLPINGVFPAQRPVTRSFDVFFDLCLNKRLSKQSRHRWFETPSRSSWRHHDGCSQTGIN